MPVDDRLVQTLKEISAQAAFNRWCQFEVLDAEPGKVALGVSWRDDFGQYSGFLHAGMVAALIDTACGFAAVTSVGTRVLAAHFSVNCLRPAVGERFIARAHVVKPGKSQVFTACALFAYKNSSEKLVATGEALLAVPAQA